MSRLHRVILIVVGLICSQEILAQIPVTFKDKNSDTLRTVLIWHADRLREETKDSAHKVQSLIGNVKLQEENTLFYCDSVILDQLHNIVESFGNVHIIDSDTTNIYSQYMKYLVDKKYIYFQKKVRLTDGKGTLYTEDLQYDLNQKIGVYNSGGKVVNQSTVLTSKEGTYYAETRDVYFRKDVVMKDPRYDLRADSLLYNTQSQLATFITMTHIKDSNGSTIDTREGFYDLANHKAAFGKRALIRQGSQRITGDNISIDEISGKSTVTGNGIFIDTAQGVSVISNKMVVNNKTNAFMATESPLMILRQDKDSIYITADTLFSGRLSDLPSTDSSSGGDSLAQKPSPTGPGNTADSSNRFLQGFHHVRIFSDSLQALADSLFYSGKDSVFRLYTNPIVWLNGIQVTGDTIFLFTENKKPKRLYVFENAIMANKVGNNMFNQVKGTTINGYFINGEMDYLRAKGNAETYYYAQDNDKAFVGVNHSTAAVIDMIFKERALHKVVLRSDAEGTMYPLRQVSFDEMRLRSFKWLDEKRPKTKFELFENPPAPQPEKQ